MKFGFPLYGRDAKTCVSTFFQTGIVLVFFLLGHSFTSLAQTVKAPFFSYCPASPTVTDHEGNRYRTVQIGSQCWMAENMRCTSSPTGKHWSFNPQFSAAQPHYSAYYAAPASNRFGMLYNWAAALDLSAQHNARTAGKHLRGICPEGWHLPDNEDWSLLFNTLGGHSVSGEKMKEPTQLWQPHLIIEKDTMGFDAEPAGSYTENGCQNTGFQACFWSADNFSRDQAWCCIVYDYKNESYSYLEYKCYGLSVRCVKDN